MSRAAMRKSSLGAKFGVEHIRKLNHKFVVQWNDDHTEFFLGFDGFNILRCMDAEYGIQLEFVCYPGQYLYGAHWAVNHTLSMVFGVSLDLSKTSTIMHVGLGSDCNTLLHKGLQLGCRYDKQKQAYYVSHIVSGEFPIARKPLVNYQRLVDHVKICSKLGMFADTPAPMNVRLHELIGGEQTYKLLSDAVFNQNYSENLMYVINQLRLTQGPRGTRFGIGSIPHDADSAVSAVTDLLNVNMTQLVVDVCQRV